MLENWNHLVETSPDAAVALALIALVVVVVLLFFLATRSRRTSTTQSSLSYQSAKVSTAPAAKEEDDETIKATGTVERTVATLVDSCSRYHLAVKLDKPLSELQGKTMLRFADDSGYIDLPLVKAGDKVALEFTIDSEGFVEVFDFTWLPES